jgi:hypothetical protein
MKWNTKEVVELLSTIPDVTIKVSGPGGDCDSDNLTIKPTSEKRKHNAVSVCGLVEDLSTCVDNPSNPSVDMAYIELRTYAAGTDQDLDDDASDEITRVFMAVKKKLRESYKKTFHFVRHYKEVY